MGQGHPPRLAHGAVAAGQGHVGQVGGALVAGVIGDEELATPDRPIVDVAGAVEGHADHRPLAAQAVLGHARGDVGVVVLHFDQRQPLAGSPFAGITSGHVVGVAVAGDDRRPRAEQALHVFDATLEGA